LVYDPIQQFTKTNQGGMMLKDICEAGMLESHMCMSNGEICSRYSCQFDYYDCVELPDNCVNCLHFEVEMTSPNFKCSENPSYQNLKSFPFKKEMDCFEGKNNQ
jgi:hypothetical protein